MGRVKQRPVGGAGRAGQQWIAVGKPSALPQALRPKVHEPAGVVRRTHHGDADVDDEESDGQRRQKIHRKVWHPWHGVGSFDPSDHSSHHGKVDGNNSDEHPIEKIQVRG